MKLMDLLIDELNSNLSEEEKQNGAKWERLYSAQYQIVQTENGIFHNFTNSAERRKG